MGYGWKGVRATQTDRHRDRWIADRQTHMSHAQIDGPTDRQTHTLTPTPTYRYWMGRQTDTPSIFHTHTDRWKD